MNHGDVIDFETARNTLERGDATGARMMLQNLADRGEAEAQNLLGYLYDQGIGVDQNLPKAAALFESAARQGLVVAECNLAVAYDFGRGKPRDPLKAAQWYLRAAEQGDTQAQNNLGILYQHSKEQDFMSALAWYFRSAEKNYAPAEFNIGYLYANGLGVLEDKAEARRWYRLAASHGHEAANVELAKLDEER